MSDVLEPRVVGKPRDDFARAVLSGLRQMPKSMPCKYFYDAAGSLLFERITELPEYYQTRTEIGILTRNAPQIARAMGAGVELVEFGAGSLRKVRILLDALEAPRSYVPIDISGDYLMEVVAELESQYPELAFDPVIADFTRPLELGPLERGTARRAGFFPGSTIGNLTRGEAIAFLRSTRETLRNGGLLIGVDLVKDPAVLHAAYNDAEGVTDAFNKNLLDRANRDLGADFDRAAFAHYAPYNPLLQRIEMYLVSLKQQRVRIAGETVTFAEGEAIHTENSHKYTVEGFKTLAGDAGYAQKAVWTDPARLFSVQWLEPA